MKELYSFTATKKDGEISTDIKVFLKRPGSFDNNMIGIVYASELSKALKRGIMSQADIRRTVLDDGGLKHSKYDKEEREKIFESLSIEQNKYQKALVEKKPVDKIEKKVLDLSLQLQKMDSELTKVFSNSAEVIANQQTLVWITSNLTLWDEDKSFVFKGEEDEDRIKSYFDAIDDGGIEKTIGEKAFVIFQNYLMFGIKDKEDLEKLEKEIETIQAKEDLS